MRADVWVCRFQVFCLCLLAGLMAAPAALAASLAEQFNQGAQQHGRNISTFRDAVEGWPLPVYTPWNATKARAQEAALAAVQKKYRDRPPANETELAEINEAMGVFLRYAKLYEEFHAPDTVLVPPNGIASVDINSYCLDAGRPSPPAEEPLRLVRYDNLFPADVVPVYQSLMRFNAQQQDNTIQGLLWTLRNISDGKSKLSSLSARDYQVLEQAHPGATAALQRAFGLDDVLQMGGKPVRNLGDLASAHLARKLGDIADIPWQPGMTVDAMLAQAAAIPVTGTADPNHAYTELSPGVIARAHNVSGHTKFHIDVVNTTGAPFVFNNTQYIAEPSRNAQRLAIGRVTNTYKPTAEAAAGYRKVEALMRDAAKKPMAGTKPNDIPNHECKLAGDSLASDVMKELSSLMPIYGEMISAYEAFTGRDFYKGTPLTLSSRLLAGLNTATIGLTAFKMAAKGATYAAKIGDVFAGAVTHARSRPDGLADITKKVGKAIARDRGAECVAALTTAAISPPAADPRWNWVDEKGTQTLKDPANWDCANASKKAPSKVRSFVGRFFGDEEAGSAARELQYHVCKGSAG